MSQVPVTCIATGRRTSTFQAEQRRWLLENPPRPEDESTTKGFGDREVVAPPQFQVLGTLDSKKGVFVSTITLRCV